MQNKKILSIFQRSFIYIFIFSLVGGFGSWLLYQKARSEETSLEAARNDYNNTLNQLDSFDSVKKDFDESVSLRDQVSNLIVGPDGTLGLIEELEGAAKASNVVLKTSIGANPTLKNMPKITNNTNNKNANQEVWLDLEVDGTFPNTLQFIKYLENAKRLVATSTISIEQSGTMAPDEVLTSPEGSLGKLKTKILVSNVF